MSEPRRIGEFVRQIVRTAGRQRTRDAFTEALDRILPEHQRSSCQVIGFRDGKLVIEVGSAPLFAELSGFQRETMRLRINELVPTSKVAQLQFRLGGTGHV